MEVVNTWRVRPPTSPRAGRQAGFTLIEALIAMGIMVVSLMALAQVMARGMTLTASSPVDLIAKEKAVSAIESVFTARDTRVLTWALIKNVNGGTGGGVFLDGPRDIRNPGLDGMVNTADDGILEGTVTPGADGELGNADDGFTPLTRMTREIEIRELSPVNAKLRQLRVIVRYQVGSVQRVYIVTTFISTYA